MSAFVVGAVPAADQEDGNGDLRQAPELDRSADLGRELARDGVDGRDATPPRGLGPERSDLLIGEHHHLPEQDVEGRADRLGEPDLHPFDDACWQLAGGGLRRGLVEQQAADVRGEQGGTDRARRAERVAVDDDADPDDASASTTAATSSNSRAT